MTEFKGSLNTPEPKSPAMSLPAETMSETKLISTMVRFINEVATIKQSIAGEVLARQNPEMLLDAIITNARGVSDVIVKNKPVR